MNTALDRKPFLESSAFDFKFHSTSTEYDRHFVEDVERLNYSNHIIPRDSTACFQHGFISSAKQNVSG
jgi:hypothetical protein